MAEPIPGVYFATRARFANGVADLANVVSSALGIELRPSTTPGLTDAFVGRALGVEVTLELAPDEPLHGTSSRWYALLGGTEVDYGVEVDWIDLTAYVVALLNEGTGVLWRSAAES